MEVITVETQPTASRNVFEVKCRVGNFDLIGINRGINLWAEMYNTEGKIFDSSYVQIEGDDWVNWPAGLTEEEDTAYVSNIILRQLGLTKRYKAYFTTSPNSQTLIVGENASFSGVAAGYPEDFTYQWYYNDSEIVGETGTTYSLTNVQTTQTGNYSLVASNGQSSVTGIAILDVLEKTVPVISVQPTDESVVSGAASQFYTYADAVPTATYQWYKDGVEIVGQTSTSIVFTGVQPENTGSYYAVATNSEGSATTNTVTLSITEV